MLTTCQQRCRRVCRHCGNFCSNKCKKIVDLMLPCARCVWNTVFYVTDRIFKCHTYRNIIERQMCYMSKYLVSIYFINIIFNAISTANCMISDNFFRTISIGKKASNDLRTEFNYAIENILLDYKYRRSVPGTISDITEVSSLIKDIIETGDIFTSFFSTFCFAKIVGSKTPSIASDLKRLGNDLSSIFKTKDKNEILKSVNLITQCRHELQESFKKERELAFMYAGISNRDPNTLFTDTTIDEISINQNKFFDTIQSMFNYPQKIIQQYQITNNIKNVINLPEIMLGHLKPLPDQNHPVVKRLSIFLNKAINIKEETIETINDETKDSYDLAISSFSDSISRPYGLDPVLLHPHIQKYIQTDNLISKHQQIIYDVSLPAIMIIIIIIYALVGRRQ